MIRPARTFVFLVSLMLAAASVHAQKKIVAYVPNWIDLNVFAATIDYSKLTHINVAFENPVNADGNISFNRKNEALIARAKTNGVKILVSIGGGSASENKALLNRYFDLLSDVKRAGFVDKLAEYVSKHGFDGLDVDIEGPSINKDYGAFIRDLAKVLKPNGKLLTSALSQGYGGNNVPNSVFEHFDFVNIMAYDGTGTWDPKRPGQHSSFEFAKRNVSYWLDRGLPKSKAVLGVPFYGYGFGDAFRKSSYAYREILAAHSGAEKVDEIGNTIWYNGIATIKAKAAYANEAGLAGAMIWSLDNDVKGERSLLTALHETLVPGPISSFERVKTATSVPPPSPH
ncbi:MAG TPA: glycosyl hydrolase family 18 protein [Candidatus Acidoferrum sp.]|nr:glycosyl hydrolase family 18 protein [Candidatus Acidoferrum sp.]